MAQATILLLEDEPFILMDLEMAAEDLNCQPVPTSNVNSALQILKGSGPIIKVGVLDVSLGNGQTCEPVARELERRNIPYILHSGNLDRHNELLRDLAGKLVPKPSSSDLVIKIALEQLALGG